MNVHVSNICRCCQGPTCCQWPPPCCHGPPPSYTRINRGSNMQYLNVVCVSYYSGIQLHMCEEVGGTLDMIHTHTDTHRDTHTQTHTHDIRRIYSTGHIREICMIQCQRCTLTLSKSTRIHLVLRDLLWCKFYRNSVINKGSSMQDLGTQKTAEREKSAREIEREREGGRGI